MISAVWCEISLGAKSDKTCSGLFAEKSGVQDNFGETPEETDHRRIISIISWLCFPKPCLDC